jgi:hypothetical protein
MVPPGWSVAQWVDIVEALHRHRALHKPQEVVEMDLVVPSVELVVLAIDGRLLTTKSIGPAGAVRLGAQGCSGRPQVGGVGGTLTILLSRPTSVPSRSRTSDDRPRAAAAARRDFSFGTGLPMKLGCPSVLDLWVIPDAADRPGEPRSGLCCWRSSWPDVHRSLPGRRLDHSRLPHRRPGPAMPARC